VQLELVCIVHASPHADVKWYKDGNLLVENRGGDDSSRRRLSIGHEGRKHLLVIPDVAETDKGRYTCHAANTLGESKGNVQVMGKTHGTMHCLTTLPPEPHLV
jgi:hypothetical protein